MRQQRSDVAHGTLYVELHEPGIECLEHLQQLVQRPRSQHLEHVVVQLVLVDAVQLQLLLLLDGIEQLQLLVRRRQQLQQLQLVLVGRLARWAPRAAISGW